MKTHTKKLNNENTKKTIAIFPATKWKQIHNKKIEKVKNSVRLVARPTGGISNLSKNAAFLLFDWRWRCGYGNVARPTGEIYNVSQRSIDVIW